MRRLLLLIAVIALLSAACGRGDLVATSTTTSGAGVSVNQEDALAAARSRWAGAAPADYTVAVSGPAGGPQTLAVHDGEVVSLSSPDAATVEELFSTIDDSLRSGAVVEVEYHPELGHPIRVVIDRNGDGSPDVDLSLGEVEEMPVVTSLEELLAAKARWEASGPTTYRYIFRAECTCDLGGTFDVEVRDGRVFNFVRLDDAARQSLELTPTPLDGAFSDLEEWFTDNAQLVAEGLLAVDVRMDPDLGYPRWFNIVVEGLGEDDLADQFTLVVTMDLVLPYTPIEEPVVTPSVDGENLRSAEERWRRAGLRDYRFVLQLICECPLAYSGPFDVTVVDGRVADVVHLGDVEGARPEAEPIPELFAVIGLSVDSGVDIDVTYHPIFGYPELAILDTAAVAVDGGLAFSVSDLRLVGDRGMIAGRATAGPQCPVQQDPPLPECVDLPVPDAMMSLAGGDGEFLFEVTAAPDGTFFFPDLEPGRYVVTAELRDDYLGNPSPIEVTVSPGSIQEVAVAYDTGIR